MPQEPKKRHSKARKRTRRASIMLKSIALVICKNCGKPTKSHIACVNCGFYRSKATTNSKVQVTSVK